jgi:branched-chain amino acid transport system substrate-binding protein
LTGQFSCPKIPYLVPSADFSRGWNGRMKSHVALPALAVALIAVASLAGWTQSNSGDPRVIKIVSSLPRTGSAKAQTDTIVNGIKIALEEANWQAGGFQIAYGDWDDATAAAGQWTAEAEIANARRAARHPDVMVYIGTYNSGAAKISMPILNKADLLMVSPANTWPGLTKPDKGDPGEPEIYRPTGKITYVRVVPADDLQGPFSAAWAKELGIKRVYVLDDNEVYGKGIATLFIEACQNLGIEVLGHESIDAKAQEFKSLMTSIKAQQPDLVYFGGTTQSKGGQIAKDLVAAGLDCKLMVPDACYEDAFIESAGAENVNDRCYVTFGGLPPDKLTGPGKAFVEKYKQRFGSEPEGYAIYGYEAAKVALRAIHDAGRKDRGAIVEACLAIKDFDRGALGRWSFDANGDTTLTTISGSIIHNGKFQFQKLLGPATATESGGGSL